MPFQGDRATLIQILQFVEKLLTELIVRIPPPEDQAQFQIAWSQEVQPKLRELIERIQSISGPNDRRWAGIQRHGLDGEQLKLKRARLAAASRKGIRKKILDIINTILSSIPGADLIKEFKELTEEALPEDQSATVATRFV